MLAFSDESEVSIDPRSVWTNTCPLSMLATVAFIVLSVVVIVPNAVVIFAVNPFMEATDAFSSLNGIFIEVVIWLPTATVRFAICAEVMPVSRAPFPETNLM